MQQVRNESIFTKLTAQQLALPGTQQYNWLESFITLCFVIDVIILLMATAIYTLSKELVALLAIPTIALCIVLTLKARQLSRNGNYEQAALVLFFSFLYIGSASVILIPTALPAVILTPLLAILASVLYLRPTTMRWAIPLAGGMMVMLTLLGKYVALFSSPIWIGKFPVIVGVLACSILLIVMFKHYHNLVIESQELLADTLIKRTAEVQEREQLFQAVSNLTSDFAFVMHIDAKGIITNEWENDTIVALTGYHATVLRAKGGFQAILHPDDRQLIFDFYASLIKGQRGSRDCRIIHADGSIHWLRTYAQPVLDQEIQRITHVFGAMQDITASKEHQQRIAELAFYDPLTSLSNRRLFHERVNALLMLVSERPFSILFLDLDRFKRVNDSLGHDVGDELLIQVASRLQMLLRPGDTLARLGGDEFSVLLTDTQSEQALAIGQRLLAELEIPFHINGHILHIGGSIGVASYPKDGHTMSLLLKHADIAMYRAKKQGSQVVCYNPAQFNVPQERLELEAELRHAIDHDQLVLYFQPIHDLYSGDIVRAEVLVRWQHPRRGLLLPGEFIRIAEESGLIRALDRWVLRNALLQCTNWYKAGTPIPISVNISAQLLADPTLIDEVHELIRITGAPANLVMIEITETAALQDMEVTLRALEQFKKLGMLIALDDFGTGHASLGRLKLLPVNVLKIDHEFTAGINQNPKDEGVLQAVVALAQGLQLLTIVEGIETIEQHEWLCEAGFEQGQGFLLARPMTPEQIIMIMFNNGGLERQVVSSSVH